MKKTMKNMLAFVAGALCIAGCAKEIISEENNESSNSISFVAVQESTDGTKAAIDETDSKKIDWSDNDKITVLDGSSNHAFTIESGAGTTQAIFSGSAEPVAQYTAIYPYQSSITLEGGMAKNVTLPWVQTATPGTFDPAAGLMMAISNAEGELAFKNVVSYIKVSTEFAVKNIRFSSLSAVAIAGEMSLSFDNGVPVAAVTGKPAVSVELVPQEGETVIPAGTYYIAVLPQALEDGFKISYLDTEGNGHIRISWDPYTAVRNKVVNMGKLDPDTYIYNNRQVLYQATEEFVPSNNDNINGKELSNNSSFTYSYDGKIGVITYTSDITSARYLFYKASAVTKVILPETITEITNFCLSGTQVKTISLPSSLRKISYGFSQYSSSDVLTLESIIFPEGLEVMETPLNGCTKVREVNIPSTVTDYIRTGASGVQRYYGKWVSEDGTYVIKDNCMTDFATGNTSITDFTVPENITSLGAACFMGANLNSVTIPSSITTLPASCFAYSNINTINLPNTLTTIEYRCFRSMTCPLIEIPASVTTLGHQMMAWSAIGEVRFAADSQVKNIPDYAFYQPYVKIPIPEGVETIGESSYYNYGDDYNLRKCDIIIPDTVTSIGETAFQASHNVESIVLGSSVESIGDHAFAYFYKIDTFKGRDIPADQQTKLKTVISKNTTPPALSEKVFCESFDNEFKIYVPAASVEAYKAADGWSQYADNIEAIQ